MVSFVLGFLGGLFVAVLCYALADIHYAVMDMHALPGPHWDIGDG